MSNRGYAWSLKKEYDKAIADYNEAIRLDPKNVASYNPLAWLLAACPDAKRRDGKRAIEIGTRACELGEWKNASHIDTLGVAYAEAGEFDKAVEWQEKAIKLYHRRQRKGGISGAAKALQGQEAVSAERLIEFDLQTGELFIRSRTLPALKFFRRRIF